MNLCTSSWSFPRCTLEEAVAITKALGFDATDLGYFHGPAVDKLQVINNPTGYADYIRSLGINVPTFYHLFGETLYDRNIAHPPSLKENLEDFARVAEFCRAAAIPVLFIIPGMVNPGQTREQAFETSVRSLQEMLPIAQEAGIILSIEAHVHSYLESPAMVLQLLGEVEGLKLILDYSHFICLGYKQEEVDELAPYAAHVHLRQARSGMLQTEMSRGTINIGALLGLLDHLEYGGYIALEAVHQEYMDTVHEDVLSEIIKMRNFCMEYAGTRKAPAGPAKRF
jgi:sugar phosphate isomerase/epimerase